MANRKWDGGYDSDLVLLDEDNMASDSDTKGSTQQSIKAYVDTSIAVIATDKIEEGNSKVEVTDAGTGNVLVNVDATDIMTFLVDRVQLDLSASILEIPSGGSLSIKDTDGDVLAYFGSNDLAALYYNNGVRIQTNSTGVSITDGTATAATIDFSGDDLYIKNNDADGEVYIQAERTGTGQSVLFHGDPDGATTLYHNNTGILATTSTGISITDGTATAATIDFSDDDLYIKNNDADGEVYIQAEKTG